MENRLSGDKRFERRMLRLEDYLHRCKLCFLIAHISDKEPGAKLTQEVDAVSST
jgi:hypothetical protein